MLRKRSRAMLLWLVVPVLAACAPAIAKGTAAPVAVETAVSGTLTALAPSQEPTTQPPSPTPTPPPPMLWACYTCGGETLWQLAPGLPHEFKLPVVMGQFYGYTTQTGRILMALAFGDHGAGPGNAAVSDLSILDLQSGHVTQILPDNVVEAAVGTRWPVFRLRPGDAFDLRVALAVRRRTGQLVGDGCQLHLVVGAFREGDCFHA